MSSSFRLTWSILLMLGFLQSCSENTSEINAADETSNNSQPTSMRISKASFGKTLDGKIVDLYTLTNANGAVAKITNYGGIITSLTMPDKNGLYEDVVLGYDSLSDYLKESPYFGALIGRYGNRIANGKFQLDNKAYSLPVNNGPNSLHGGTKGFDKVLWDVSTVQTDSGVGLKLLYESPDGDQGYPGNLKVEVNYLLGNDNTFNINYKASTDQRTIVNLTQHSYFNLSGNTRNNILDHLLTLNADQYIPINADLIPLGKPKDVSGTPFDFREATPIGKGINDGDIQLKNGNGYDHCWVLNTSDSTLHFAARLEHPTNGRTLEVYTSEPGIQFYSGNFLDGTIKGKYNQVYHKYTGMALETQHFPDSPNQPEFPSVILNPGDIYSSSTTYKFSVKE